MENENKDPIDSEPSKTKAYGGGLGNYVEQQPTANLEDNKTSNPTKIHQAGEQIQTTVPIDSAPSKTEAYGKGLGNYAEPQPSRNFIRSFIQKLKGK